MSQSGSTFFKLFKSFTGSQKKPDYSGGTALMETSEEEQMRYDASFQRGLRDALRER